MIKRLLICLFCIAFAAPAIAYVGPGPGLSMVGSFFTLVAGIVIALLMVLLWPIRMLMQRRKSKQMPQDTTPDNPS